MLVLEARTVQTTHTVCLALDLVIICSAVEVQLCPVMGLVILLLSVVLLSLLGQTIFNLVFSPPQRLKLMAHIHLGVQHVMMIMQ